MIVFVMFLLLWFGGEFGVSSNLRTLCSISGAGKYSSFFDWDWRSKIWNIVFVGGAIIGGHIASHYLASDVPVQIASSTQEHLSSIGIITPQTMSEGAGFVPSEIFDSPFTFVNLLLLVGGGFLIGFGTRYAGGCTSGHAISGLSNLQLPSLIAVIGFFIGGLFVTWIVLPNIL